MVLNVKNISTDEQGTIKRLGEEFPRNLKPVRFDIRDPDAIIEQIQLNKGFDGITVRTHSAMTPEVIAAATAETLQRPLKAIGRAGVGVNNIALDAATEHGVVVSNTPGSNANAVGELVIGQMLALARRSHHFNQTTHEGEWKKAEAATTTQELRGKTLGLVGLGNTGGAVAWKALAMGMEVVAYDTNGKAAEFADVPGFTRVSTVEDVLQQAQFLSVHIPLTRKTEYLINKDALANLPQGAFVINASRGEVVDEQALADMLKSGHVAGAAVDVFAREGAGFDSPLRDVPNAILTPHIGGSTQEALMEAAKRVTTQVSNIVNGVYAGVPVVNTAVLDRLGVSNAPDATKSAKPSQPPLIEAVILDWEGTSANSKQAAYTAINAALQETFQEPWFTEKARAQLALLESEGKEREVGWVEHVLEHGALPVEVVQEEKYTRTPLIKAILGHGSEECTRFNRVYDHHYLAELEKDGQLKPMTEFVETTVRQLRAMGVQVGIGTNRAWDQLGDQLRTLGWDDNFFDVIVTPDEVEGKQKPEPDILLEVAAQLGISPQDMAFMGDNSTDVRTARNAGCGHAMLFDPKGQWRGEELHNLAPDAVVGTYGALLAYVLTNHIAHGKADNLLITNIETARSGLQTELSAGVNRAR